MAIATIGGHTSRAIDFYNAAGKYFIIGGTSPWEDETNPTAPSISDFKLRDIVGLKKVDNTYFVVPDDNGTIQYRSQNWRIVAPTINTTIGAGGITSGSYVVPVTSVAGLVVPSETTTASKIRINNLYEGTIQSISGLLVTLDTAAPTNIPAGSPVLGGALVEGAKYVYVDCYLNYDEFPLQANGASTNYSYRQVGLCTGVTPNTQDILRGAGFGSATVNDFTSIGVLEILDNRVPSTRDVNQRELLSLIIEF